MCGSAMTGILIISEERHLIAICNLEIHCGMRINKRPHGARLAQPVVANRTCKRGSQLTSNAFKPC